MRYIIFLLIILSCGQPQEVPKSLSDIPSDFYNKLTPEKVRIGEFFFRSKLISVDGRSACINCHDPARGMTSPFEDIVGGVGVGGLVIKDENEKYLIGHVDEFYEGQRDSMLIKAYGGVGSAHSPIMGHSGRFGFKGKSEAEKALTRRHFNLPENYPDFEATRHQAEMALNGHELLVQKRLLSDKECRDILTDNGHIVTDTTHADSLKKWIADGLDAYQRSLFPFNAPYITGNMTMHQLSGMELVEKHCRSCHSTFFFSGGLEDSFQTDFNNVNDFGKVDPSCYEDVFGDRREGRPVRRITKPLMCNMKDHFQYGVAGQYSTYDAYMIDKYAFLESRGVVVDKFEREQIKEFVLDGLYDPYLENSWMRLLE